MRFIKTSLIIIVLSVVITCTLTALTNATVFVGDKQIAPIPEKAPGVYVNDTKVNPPTENKNHIDTLFAEQLQKAVIELEQENTKLKKENDELLRTMNALMIAMDKVCTNNPEEVCKIILEHQCPYTKPE